MKAVVYNRFGGPEVLEVKDLQKPVPRDNEVLVEVRAASVNPLDGGLIHGMPSIVRLLFGLPKPSDTPLGVDVAGQVEAVGKSVSRFRPGDEVFGACVSDPRASAVKVWTPQGAFAEYACAHEGALATKPGNVTFEQAASAPIAVLTALQGLRLGGVGGMRNQSGRTVLINGAAGGVGTFAVQIAKAFGAVVTGVCSTRNMEMVRSIGADHVIAYTQEDFTHRGPKYDLIFDCVGNHSPSACRRVLNPQGVCVMVGDLTGGGAVGMLGRVAAALVLTRFTSQKLVAFLARPNQEDLTTARDLMEAGKVIPVIDRRYSLTEVPEAIRYLQEKHARGKVVISVSELPMMRETNPGSVGPLVS